MPNKLPGEPGNADVNALNIAKPESPFLEALAHRRAATANEHLSRAVLAMGINPIVDRKLPENQIRLEGEQIIRNTVFGSLKPGRTDQVFVRAITGPGPGFNDIHFVLAVNELGGVLSVHYYPDVDSDSVEERSTSLPRGKEGQVGAVTCPVGDLVSILAQDAKEAIYSGHSALSRFTVSVDGEIRG